MQLNNITQLLALTTQELTTGVGILPVSRFLSATSLAVHNFSAIATPSHKLNDGGHPLRQDGRWQYGVPPVGNANFAWVQHFLYHLASTGAAGFVLSNGSLSSNTSGEGEIREQLVRSDLVDCIVMLPTQLFYNTGISACLWFLSRYKNGNKNRDHKGEVLFIDASELGYRTHLRSIPETTRLAASWFYPCSCKKQSCVLQALSLIAK